MKKILLFLFVLPLFTSAQKGKYGKYSFEDTLRIKKVANTSGTGMRILVRDTIADSPTYGKVFQIEIPSTSSQSLTKSVFIENVSGSENIGIWRTPVDITIDSVSAVLVGSSSPSVTFQIVFSSDRSAAGTDVFSSNRTVTSTSSGTNFSSSFGDATIPAGSWIWIITTAMSGTVTQIELTIKYTED